MDSFNALHYIQCLIFIYLIIQVIQTRFLWKQWTETGSLWVMWFILQHMKPNIGTGKHNSTAVANNTGGAPCLCQLRRNDTCASSTDLVEEHCSSCHRSQSNPDFPPKATCCVNSLLTSSTKMVQELFSGSEIVMSHWTALLPYFKSKWHKMSLVTACTVKSSNLRKAGNRHYWK